MFECVAAAVASFVAQGKFPMETNPSLIAFNTRAKALDVSYPAECPNAMLSCVTKDPHGYYQTTPRQDYAMGADPYQRIRTQD